MRVTAVTSETQIMLIQLGLDEHDLQKSWWLQLKPIEHKSWGLQLELVEHDLQKSWGSTSEILRQVWQKFRWSTSEILRHVSDVLWSETRKYFADNSDVTQLKFCQIRSCFTIWLSRKHNRNIFHFMKRDEVKSDKIPSKITDVMIVVFDRVCWWIWDRDYNYAKPVTGL